MANHLSDARVPFSQLNDCEIDMPRTLAKTLSTLAFSSVLAIASVAFAQSASKPEPLVIQDQGSLAVGGTVSKTAGTYSNNTPTAEGQTLHGDHAYVFYQVPQDPKPLPINRWPIADVDDSRGADE